MLDLTNLSYVHVPHHPSFPSLVPCIAFTITGLTLSLMVLPLFFFFLFEEIRFHFKCLSQLEPEAFFLFELLHFFKAGMLCSLALFPVISDFCLHEKCFLMCKTVRKLPLK